MGTKGEHTREKILAEASRLFELQGFRATSLSDLQTATGLKKGALYFHFKNKDEIGLAVLGRAREEFDVFLEQALVGATPSACLENFFTNILEWQSQLSFCGGCLFGNIALEMGDTDPRFSGFVDQVFTHWIACLSKVIAGGQNSGDIRSDLPASVLARHVVATTEGGIMLSRLKKNDQPLKDCFDCLRIVLGIEQRESP